MSGFHPTFDRESKFFYLERDEQVLLMEFYSTLTFLTSFSALPSSRIFLCLISLSTPGTSWGHCSGMGRRFRGETRVSVLRLPGPAVTPRTVIRGPRTPGVPFGPSKSCPCLFLRGHDPIRPKITESPSSRPPYTRGPGRLSTLEDKSENGRKVSPWFVKFRGTVRSGGNWWNC